MSRVQSDGSGGFVFAGTNASNHYYGHVGQPIPLESNTLCHWADGVRSDTSNGWTSLSYEDNQPFRITFSELDFGTLQDIGYTVAAFPRFPVKVDANPGQGFNWPYYLYVPTSAGTSTTLVVEPNNTGYESDDFSVHDASAQLTAWSNPSEAIAFERLANGPLRFFLGEV